MPHYEQLKCRNNRVSLRSYNDGNASVVNINLFKPIMIALAIILFLSLLFAVLKYYNPIIQLNVRNFLKKDKEIVDGLAVNALSSTNFTQRFLNNFDNFKFLIQDDDNTNSKFSIDTFNFGNNKYSAILGSLDNSSTNTNKTIVDENNYSITRSSIEPFFNNYTNENKADTNGSTIEVKNKPIIKDLSFSWDNAFNWIKSKDNLFNHVNTNVGIIENSTNNIIENLKEQPVKTETINSNKNTEIIETKKPSDSPNEIESKYFNSVLKPRKTKVMVNTMKPAVTPNKYRNEEYYSNSHTKVSNVKYDEPYYSKTEEKPVVKKKIVKVEDRYTTNIDTNKKPIVINVETIKKQNPIDSKKYNTNYRIEEKENNILILNEKENRVNNNHNKTPQKENVANNSIPQIYIPSKEYRKIIEHRLESIKNESSKADIEKKYTTAITNKNELPKETKKYIFDNTNNSYTPSSYKDIEKQYQIPEIEQTTVVKYETPKKDDNTDSIVRMNNNDIVKNNIEKENIINRELKQQDVLKENKPNDFTSPITRIKKPQNKNYIYLVEFNENNNSISLVRRERTFKDSNIKTIVNSLLIGATDSENSKDIFSAISRDTKLLDVFIDIDTLYINLSEDFEYNPLGSEGMMVSIYQIVYTLTQFENINNVIFLINGSFNETIGSEGLIINRIFKRLENEKYILDIN